MGAIGGEQVIVKEVKATRDAPLWRLFREVYIQAAVSIEDAEGNHKHVTKLKGWSVKDGGSGQLTEYTAEDCFYIVLEYAGTELHTFIDWRGGPINFGERSFLVETKVTPLADAVKAVWR